MSEITNQKQNVYDLEDRCFTFTKRIHTFARKLPKDIPNFETTKQLVRSAGSIGANYIEANEALSRKDFLMRIRISKKEAKETIYWLRLIEPSRELEQERLYLVDECTQLMKILGAIYDKSRAP